jgi:ribonucleoside-diphosphate reductase alpha chain
MEAVKEGEDWVLFFHEPPCTRDAELTDYDFVDDNMIQQYAYSVWKARDLWDMILQNTYEHSEPGVIFIDRVNEINNLHYLEEIRCTNPCGEQPLPPHGTCNLGHVNLARMVKDPFTSHASFDFGLLRSIAAIGVRFLDNVIDVTNYPLPQQEHEEQSKRRLGLGFTGLADAMHQLGYRYGSLKSAEFAELVCRTICESAYWASIGLAEERGPFPLFDASEYLAPNTFAAKMLTDEMHAKIQQSGIRNGLILTVAPTGTGSCVYGNVAGGLEPTFAHRATRKVLQPDGSHKSYTEYGYAAQIYRSIFGDTEEWPTHMVEMKDLTVDDHITIMSRIQRWVDASVSKTINVPKDITYENFVRVYELAYVNGCKGCTTYRPSETRGSVLDAAGGDSPRESTQLKGNEGTPLTEVLLERSQHLDGRTYKIKWPGRDSAIYVTINHTEDFKPFEVFITSKDGRDQEFTTALTILMTGIFRRGGDVTWIATELQQVRSMLQGHWLEQKYWPSIVAYIGHLLERHLAELQQISEHQPTIQINIHAAHSDPVEVMIGEICPKCGAPGMVKEEGCTKCKSCGHSECG